MKIRSAIIISVLIICFSGCRKPIVHPPGVLVSNPPVQVTHMRSQRSFLHNDYLITILADFDITARVIRTRRYNYGPESPISPLDIALGWGSMSDTEILEQLRFRQHSRFLFYQWERRPPIPADEINRNAANIHMIPANKSVERQLKRLRPGHIVQMQGYLVQVNQERFRWRSSLTREDTGAGACEILYVEYIEVLDPFEFYTYD